MAFIGMVGSARLARFHLSAFCDALREALVPARILQLVSRTVLRHTAAACDSHVPYFPPAARHALGMGRHRCDSRRVARQLLQDVCKAEKEAITAQNGKIWGKIATKKEKSNIKKKK